MLLDISGNTFFGLNRTIPTVTYNPKQIFGNDLYCWIDTTDYRTLYATRTGTTNISPIGSSVINRMEDLSNNFIGSSHSSPDNPNSRTFFPFSGNTAQVNNVMIYSSSQTIANVWCGQTIDTNKGRFKASTLFIHTGLTSNPRNLIGKANSAATVCSFVNIPQAALSTGAFMGLVIGPGFNTSLGMTLVGNSSSLQFLTVSSSYTGTVSRFAINVAPLFNNNFMSLFTVTGNSYYVYINDRLITSGTMTNYNYPLTTSTAQHIFFDCYIGGFPTENSNGLVTYESFIVDNYTTPQQVNLINNYFKIKYKDRRAL